MNADFQFYPTPISLAKRVWDKVKNPRPTRILEPSAGKGDLLLGMHGADRRHSAYSNVSFKNVDCCEIDISHHGALRELGANIVGHDFLQFEGGSIYDLVILNPPFAQGDKHVLKAFDMLWAGEVVAILNSETLRNPLSAERKRLVTLIENHGDVEFVAGAFEIDEAERKTSVEIAIVHLVKTVEPSSFITANLLRDMTSDSTTAEALAEGYAERRGVALPSNQIENSVRVFRAAVRAAQDAAQAQAQADYYASLLGDTMAASKATGFSDRIKAPSVEYVRNTLAASYDKLKDRAWTQIIQSVDVTSRLSSQAQMRVEAEFERIKQLDYTVSNVYSFLIGVCENQGAMQLDTMCDVFDTVSRYHSDNTSYYRGWRSNDAHRFSIGRRIKYTRFVLPGYKCEKWDRSRSLPYSAERLLNDFDRCFSLLDGKATPPIGMVDACRLNYEALRSGTRIKASYFELRYYPGAGTIHFFPTSKKLIDRLNRFVGQHRRWLPQDNEQVASEGFWTQYEQAEKFDKEVRDAVGKRTRSPIDNPFWRIDRNIGDHFDQAESDRAHKTVDDALRSVHEGHGITVEFQLTSESQKKAVERDSPQLHLLDAA